MKDFLRQLERVDDINQLVEARDLIDKKLSISKYNIQDSDFEFLAKLVNAGNIFIAYDLINQHREIFISLALDMEVEGAEELAERENFKPIEYEVVEDEALTIAEKIFEEMRSDRGDFEKYYFIAAKYNVQDEFMHLGCNYVGSSRILDTFYRGDLPILGESRCYLSYKDNVNLKNSVEKYLNIIRSTNIHLSSILSYINDPFERQTLVLEYVKEKR